MTIKIIIIGTNAQIFNYNHQWVIHSRKCSINRLGRSTPIRDSKAPHTHSPVYILSTIYNILENPWSRLDLSYHQIGYHHPGIFDYF